MAEEEERTLETEGTEGEASSAEGEVQENQDDPIEALAAEMGWAPKDQFKGPEDEWKPAKDFIVAGRDITRSLSRELKSVRDEVSRMGRVSSQILEDKLADRDAYWQRVQAKAVEEGDNDTVNRAIDERIKLKSAGPQAGPDTEVAAWMQRNAWFNSDPLAQDRAREISNRLAAQGHDTATQLREAERAIRREFPEHFPTKAKEQAATQTGASRKTGSSSKVKGFNDMPAESQQMAREYEKRHGIKPEEFAKSYWADQEGKRRVG